MTNCPVFDCPTVEYSVLTQRVRESCQGQRVPLSGMLWLTTDCNLRCRHCFIGREDLIPRPQLLSAVEIFDLLEQLAAAGCVWLTLTGGEPLTRRDFLPIYDRAWELGFQIILYTNATLLTDAIAQHLARHPPLNVEVSCYGVSSETYDQMSQTSGSFAAFRAGVASLQAAGVPLALKFPVSKGNIAELPTFRDWAEGIGAKYIYDGLLMPKFSHDRSPCKLRLDTADLVELEIKDPRKLALRLSQYHSPNPTTKIGQPGCLYDCDAGRYSFNISADGRLYSCDLCRGSSFDLRKGSFLEGWDGYLAQEATRCLPATIKCVACRLRVLCAQCPGRAWLEHSDDCQPVSYLCDFTHALAERLERID